MCSFLLRQDVEKLILNLSSFEYKIRKSRILYWLFFSRTAIKQVISSAEKPIMHWIMEVLVM